MRRITYVCTLVCCLSSTIVSADIITSPSDPALTGGITITFDDLPIGNLIDTLSSGPIAIDGITITENTTIANGHTFPDPQLSINGVTFSNGGDTTYFATGEEPPGGDQLPLKGLAIRREGEQFGGTSDSTNHVLQRRTGNRVNFKDRPGPLNTIQVTFNPPATALGLSFGGNQSPGVQTIAIYNTANELVTPPIPHQYMGAGYNGLTSYYGYSIDVENEEKIAYVKLGNKNTHDAIWINDLTYKAPQSTPPSVLDRWRWRWIQPWVPLFAFAILATVGYLVRRRRLSQQNK